MIKSYGSANRLLAVGIAILLYEIFAQQRLTAFMKYVLTALLLVICPVTAVILSGILPQGCNRELLWTLVPVTALVAYAGVCFLWDMVPALSGSGKRSLLAVPLVLGVLFLLGNQGRGQQVSAEEAEKRACYREVAECLLEDSVLWGPAELMQWVRANRADVKLPYGKDMWDSAAAAYDGDAYTAELTAAYEWMQQVEEFAGQLYLATDVELPVPVELGSRLAECFAEAEKQGVSVIVLPAAVYQRLAADIPEKYTMREVAGYTLLSNA